ncbi:helix-turn-helix domain-containing protein [Propionibacteriaceae bacterium Y2011]|uniref:helix-turn-helix domain-containing protein n=1 Tax=Microlunatus sp. Y2014 TaxID=3418488 RepID=UPI003B49AE90
MPIDLTEPPEVINCGVGRHGVRQSVDVYRLPDLWAFHHFHYTCDLLIDGVAHLVRPGTVTLVPPGALTEYRYRGPSNHEYAHLRAPAIGECEPVVRTADRNLITLPAHFAAAVAHTTTVPERCRAELWLALLQLTAADPAGPHAEGDHVARAVQWIESHLDRPITVPQVAAAVGISHTHLTRLVRADSGRTVVGHIRQRRIDRARHLLRSSTLTVSAVAAAVGFADLQTFNKACRQETGRSPRQLRVDGDTA